VVTNQPGYTYSWWYVNSRNDTVYFSSTSNKTEDIFWDMEGNFELFSQATDQNNCLSEIISKPFVVLKIQPDFIVDAGNDTIISGNKPFQLHAHVVEEPGETYTYEWFPKENLDNPFIPNPVYTPGTTSQFVVTVTNSKGISVSDTINLTIVYLIADAGEDVYMEQNSTVMLNGTGSVGNGLQFKWTTITGKIDSGENTATPIVSGFGAYYLEITDELGAVATDSVNVFRLTHAPVANNDFDTTRYLTEVKIPVLNNDTDKENSIVPSTLSISISPVNGTAYVDFDDYTVHYRPNEGFSGTDNFEYKVCNVYNECDQANVYVLVTDFKFLVPNAFSPNDDGINDYFEILGIDYYEGNSITIVNRWGNKVYEAKNYGISTTPKFWDGKANTGARIGNDELPTGTYYYILELGNGEKPIGGSIYLDR
jgi:gliding motility-associated-like protein